MVAVGRALMIDPKLILLDEPTAGLSPRYMSEIFDRILAVNATGVTVAMVEQNAKQALGIAHKGFVLASGRNRFTDTGAALLADPDVAKSFLAAEAEASRFDRTLRDNPLDELVFFINRGLMGGLIIGSIYALGAVGVTLIFGILRFAHFAHGDMMTAAAFFAFLLASLCAAYGIVLPIPLALALLPVVMVLTSLFAIGLDKAFYKPLRDRGARPVVMVMASIGVALMLQGLIRLFAGTGSRDMYLDAPKQIFRIPTGGRPIVITEPQVALIALTVVSVIALHLFLTRSRLGKAMRAVSDNPDLARVTGIPLDTVVKATWVIGGSLAAIAGTMLAMDVQLKPDLAYNILLPIFAAAILGGIGQPYGAIAGGYLIGFAETLSVFNLSVILRPFQGLLPAGVEIPANLAFVPTEYRLVVPFFILVVVLIYRPTGIFKGRVF